MIYLYKEGDTIFVSNESSINSDYTFIKSFKEINLKNHNLTLPKLNTNPINTNLYNTKIGYIIILNKELEIKVFEQFDILKEYSIEESDLVFELYLINNILKVYSYPFSFDKYYIICPSCKTKINEAILSCLKCSKGICSHCNVLDNYLCDDCNTEDILF